MDEADPAERYGERDPGRHQGPLAGGQGQLGDRRQVGPRIARVRVVRVPGLRVQQPDGTSIRVSALASVVTATSPGLGLWVGR